MNSMPCTPPEFNKAPEKWWLEDYFPIGKVLFQGRTVKLQEGKWGVILGILGISDKDRYLSTRWAVPIVMS